MLNVVFVVVLGTTLPLAEASVFEQYDKLIIIKVVDLIRTNNLYFFF